MKMITHLFALAVTIFVGDQLLAGDLITNCVLGSATINGRQARLEKRCAVGAKTTRNVWNDLEEIRQNRVLWFDRDMGNIGYRLDPEGYLVLEYTDTDGNVIDSVSSSNTISGDSEMVRFFFDGEVDGRRVRINYFCSAYISGYER